MNAKQIIENKKAYLHLLIFCSIIVINSGCAKTLQVHETPETTLQNESARIYVFRPSSFAYAIRQEVYENNSIAGQVGARGYIAWDMKPGPVTLHGPWGFIKVIAQPGKSYYFKIRPKIFGFGRRAFILTSISEEAGKSYISKLKMPKVRIVS